MEDKSANVTLLRDSNALTTVDQSKLATERSKLERMCQQFHDQVGCVKSFHLLPTDFITEYRVLRKSKEANLRLFAILLLGIATKCRNTFLLSRRIMNELIKNAPVRDSGIGQQTYNGFISMLLSYGILVCLEKPTRNKAGSYKLVNEIYANLAIDESQLIEKLEAKENENTFSNDNDNDNDNENSNSNSNSNDNNNKTNISNIFDNKDSKKDSKSEAIEPKLIESEQTKPSAKNPSIYDNLKKYLKLTKTAFKEKTFQLDANLFDHGVTDDPDMSKYFDGIVVDWFEKINKEVNPDTKLSFYKTFASTIVGEWKSYEGLKNKNWEPGLVFKTICKFWNNEVGWFTTPKGEHLNRPVSYLYAIVKANWKESNNQH